MAIALDQINPTIVYAGDYSAIIVWEHYLSATDCNIYAQKIWGGAGGTIGTLQWLATGIPVSTLHDSKQMHPQAIADGSGGAIIVYEDGQNLLANGYDIYGQHLNSAGGYTGAGVIGGYPICTWDTDQTLPMITYSNSATNNAIYAWLDHRNEATPSIHDVYTLGAQIQTLPVELSSFTAILTAEYFVNLTWVTESETQVLGFNVYRAETNDIASAIRINASAIGATNTSQQHTYSMTDREVDTDATYYYWLENVDMGGGNALHGPQMVTVTGDTTPVLPEISFLNSAYPNPFRSGVNTNISVSVKAGEKGTVTIYNILGQTVKTFTVNEGTHTLKWDGNNCGSGIYFYRLFTPTTVATKKLVIVR
jgi:hypothetical protein